eukprot:2839094-Rhodomonas_salina.1
MEGQNHEKESPDMEEGAEDEEAPARETAEPRADARTPVRAFSATEDGEQSREEAPGEEDGGGAAGLASGGDVVSEELGGEGGTQSGADADKAEEGGQRVVVKEGEREPATDGEARGEASGENETDAESEVVREDVGDIEADVKPLMQFETIQEGAESVMEQVISFPLVLFRSFSFCFVLSRSVSLCLFRSRLLSFSLARSCALSRFRFDPPAVRGMWTRCPGDEGGGLRVEADARVAATGESGEANLRRVPATRGVRDRGDGGRDRLSSVEKAAGMQADSPRAVGFRVEVCGLELGLGLGLRV